MILSPHQSEQLEIATSGNVGLLTGLPGTGKSTVVAECIRQLLSTNGHGGIAVAAPTGKAARRLTEYLRGQSISLDATTIHRLLGYTWADGGGYFSRNRQNPLPYSHVFIDEFSMCDSGLMASFMSARRPGAKVLLSGDPNQLPPVGNGAPLRDAIAMGLPHGHLSEIHRNAGRIVRTCKSIIEEQCWESSRELDIAAGENLFVDSEWRGPAGQIECLRKWLSPASPLFEIAGVTDPIWDIQVIVPLNKKSEVARVPLNKMLQGLLNPDGEQIAGNPFRVGDKIVCGKNGWYASAPGCPRDEQNNEGKVYCANGEQGRVVEVMPRSSVVELSLPMRLVKTGKASTGDDDSGKWELAFAISAHKSQGAQFPATLVVADQSSGANWLCDRHWLLTAISRAEKASIVIGKPKTLQDWCGKSHLWKRKTFAVQKYFELLVA